MNPQRLILGPTIRGTRRLLLSSFPCPVSVPFLSRWGGLDGHPEPLHAFLNSRRFGGLVFHR